MEPAETLHLLLRIASFAGGVYLVAYSVLAGIRTFVLPRPVSVLVFRLVFKNIRRVFDIRAARAGSYEEKDRVMSLYAPVALFIMPVALLILVMLGFMAIYWALSPLSLVESFKLSGSALFTLGSFTNDEPLLMVFEFAQALLGMVLVALLIAYLPTIYNAFTRRETQVQLLEMRAGRPPSPWEFIVQARHNNELEELGDFWRTWQVWFADVEESHSSLAALAFFRSSRPTISWVTAAGVVLDSAALLLSTVDVRREPQAAYCLRSGYMALQQIAFFFGITYNENPTPDDPITITRQEYDEACRYMADNGVPLLSDRDQTWRDYSGWRVNYDTALLALASLTMAPDAPWSSDRPILPAVSDDDDNDAGEWE